MAFVCEMALAMHLLRSLIQKTRTTVTGITEAS